MIGNVRPASELHAFAVGLDPMCDKSEDCGELPASWLRTCRRRAVEWLQGDGE